MSPYISIEETPIKIPVEVTAWPEGERLAGISGFGFGGTNCHVILEEAPPREAAGNETDRPLHVLALGAKNEPALLELAQRYEAWLAAHRDADLADVCFTANTGRVHGECRLAVIGESVEEILGRCC